MVTPPLTVWFLWLQEQDLAENEMMQKYMRPPSHDEKTKAPPGAHQRGFTVRDAPWDMSSNEDFPSIGAGKPTPAAVPGPPGPVPGAPRANVAWGPARR